MAPTSTAISGQLRQLVYYHLDNYSYDNALFYAERLTAHDPRSSESVYLLALSHFRLGDYRTACEYSKAVAYRGSHLGCAFVFAQACLDYGHTRQVSGGTRPQAVPPHPDAATVFCLLGKLYRLYDDKKKAIICFEESLKANPFIWDAFTALCDMGGFRKRPASRYLIRTGGGGFVNPLEPATKKSSLRTAIYENTDPFDAHRAASGNEMFLSNNISSFDTAENEFMAKINAARSRMASGSLRIPDGLETPPTNIQDYPNVPRLGLAHEPAHGAPKKTRNAQAADPLDIPPKVSYRLGTRRNVRPQDKAHDEVPPESLSGSLRPPTTSVPGFERKRTVSGHPVQPRQQSEEPGAPPRRSTRINMFRGANSKANSGAATVGAAATRELKKARPPISRIMRPTTSSGTSVGRAVSGNRKPMDDNGMDVDHAEAPRIKEPPPQAPMVKPAEPESVKVEETLKYLLDLLKKVHQETPWVLSQMGRAYYEQANYGEAEKQYRRLRILAPTRLEDMEVYSTILWFLKRETDLCFLAHDLVDSAWHSPQAWCALGNAWSLARDHEQALRCFKRATQLNPSFAYAFTLQGHEHVANEEYEKALTAYRQAISADRRHYNAYYGIGRVYEKLGNYDKAYTHFHTASVINPTNAVLICCIGNVLERQRQTVQALQYFSKATELAPNAAQTRYKKARALLALNQLDAAQRELEILKHLAPDEATVHFLLGKLYKSLNDKSQAVRHFTIALNLDPKASQQIKEAIESLEEDSYEDSMMA
ncbi:hypothetical protein PG994_011717 [Apiospora phragmitis]|uniref:Uncharacterized protein n=1 Tax=Apiospora phragmitis TaxID=2905665 RepID=A0ABR1TTY3_9PEZI